VVNTRDLDRIVNKRIHQALEEERKRASLAQIASENAEFSSSPREAANDDSAEKRSLCDPKNCLLPFCVTICSPRGRLLSIAIISAIFGTASIVVAIIYVATNRTAPSRRVERGLDKWTVFCRNQYRLPTQDLVQ
jgi:hypothetical protein